MQSLSIALLQISPCTTREGNLEKGLNACRKAKEAGADIALFPEMWNTGYALSRDLKINEENAVPADGEFTGAFAALAKELDMPVDRVREILKISQEPVSLETPIGEEEDSHLGDFIQDDNVPVPAEAAAQTLLKEQLDEVLDTLTEREQKVLRLRFGMNDGRARTLEEVGREFDVTRERIRQIEAKALRKLRHPSRSRKLRDYLD